jgi:small GTP-binding protein
LWFAQFADCHADEKLLNFIIYDNLRFWNNVYFITDLSPLYKHVLQGKLSHLFLHPNPVYGIPNILLGNDIATNCLENLKNYWQDLAKGSERQQQLKVQLVGNGRVGKTTLAHALEHKYAPSESFKSTHGIVIKEIQQALDGEDEPVTLQLWDFGGQEIYHATHRLFLSEDCLYLLLWAEETEEHPDETRPPVSYWLELIHDLGKNSPVILVKNQIDRSDRLPTRPPELTDDMPGVSQIRQEVKISAMQYRGMPTLRGAIESVLEELKHQVCLELPISWLQVQRELKKLDQNTTPFAHFKQLCIKAGIDHAEWFVDYLHKTGVLFYREGAFQDQIILNQD